MKTKKYPFPLGDKGGMQRFGLRQQDMYGLMVGLLGAAQACAAGGHHAVDDAALLEPGRCQVDTWFERETTGTRSLLHAGPVCRVGSVELGLNVDRLRFSGASVTTVFGPQIKWAVPLSENWSAGLLLSGTALDRAPHYLGSTLVIPVTWRASEAVLVHLNAGRDFRRSDRDSNRAGLALEWAPWESWSFVAERFRESGANLWRAGARWALTSTVTIDLSRASATGSGPPAWWTLGVTWGFDR